MGRTAQQVATLKRIKQTRLEFMKELARQKYSDCTIGECEDEFTTHNEELKETHLTEGFPVMYPGPNETDPAMSIVGEIQKKDMPAFVTHFIVQMKQHKEGKLKKTYKDLGQRHKEISKAYRPVLPSKVDPWRFDLLATCIGQELKNPSSQATPRSDSIWYMWDTMGPKQRARFEKKQKDSIELLQWLRKQTYYSRGGQAMPSASQISSKETMAPSIL